ncbi:alkene reductase [Desulfosarcina sp.]|uniref:alkene reductase n=1 Tax=Desulfosarcina sp. TaxID=2027861 RepID=UPI003970E845
MPTQLLTAYTLGPLVLPNRMVMAPMTRNRADENGVPKPMAVTHYVQRATAGLLITEATQVSESANGYMFTPGICTENQAEGWRAVTEAVHQHGGRIFNQLWHAGRVSHPSLQPDGKDPVAPSAVKADTMVFTPNGFEPPGMPRALATDEIPGIVGQFAHAARLAKRTGFDGVEVHGANGYLIEQFLKDGSNRRTDAYGGDIPNRMRFALEVVTAVVEVWGPGRVGLRISPRGVFNDMHESDPLALYSRLAAALNDIPLAYLHLIEPLPGHPTFKSQAGVAPVAAALRKIYTGTLMINGGYGRESAEKAVAENAADLVAFGVPYLANPDLLERYRRNAPLNVPDPDSFYGGDEKGYNDYPFLNEPR